MKLGVISDCFKKPLKESIEMAGAMHFSGVQIYAVGGAFCPQKLTVEEIYDYRKLIAEQHLEISALCGDLGGHGFELAEQNGKRIEKTCRILDLAEILEVPVVTTHIGVIPEDTECEKYRVMLEAVGACGEYASARGLTLAIETGPETAPVLNRFVRAAGKGIGVNLDPANFVMVTGQDPAEAVYLMKDLIVHTHLKDGKMLKKSNPVEIYDRFAGGGIETLNVADYFIETPIGEGDVNFSSYFQALRDVGYDGFLTIERETGKDPAADIEKAVAFMKKEYGSFLN